MSEGFERGGDKRGVCGSRAVHCFGVFLVSLLEWRRASGWGRKEGKCNSFVFCISISPFLFYFLPLLLKKRGFPPHY